MLCTQGGERDVVKLLDFGLVKEFAVDRDIELTAASNLLGTPQYMAPESIRQPDAADVRTDIYAVGAPAQGVGQYLSKPLSAAGLLQAVNRSSRSYPSA